MSHIRTSHTTLGLGKGYKYGPLTKEASNPDRYTLDQWRHWFNTKMRIPDWGYQRLALFAVWR